ncbi:MAG: zinc-ribbon domain-containing protein [Nitrospinota bacterium]
MIAVAIGLMTAGALAAVLYPFLRREDAGKAEDTQWRLRELLAAKHTIYSTLKELDFDRVAGKLSEADFRQLEVQYRERAIRVLRELDELTEGRREGEDLDEDLSETLEREILALRKAARSAPGPMEEAERASEPAQPAHDVRDELDAPPEPRFCRNCGVPVSSTDNFCSSCGIPLRARSQEGSV